MNFAMRSSCLGELIHCTTNGCSCGPVLVELRSQLATSCVALQSEHNAARFHGDFSNAVSNIWADLRGTNRSSSDYRRQQNPSIILGDRLEDPGRLQHRISMFPEHADDIHAKHPPLPPDMTF